MYLIFLCIFIVFVFLLCVCLLLEIEYLYLPMNARCGYLMLFEIVCVSHDWGIKGIKKKVFFLDVYLCWNKLILNSIVYLCCWLSHPRWVMYSEPTATLSLGTGGPFSRIWVLEAVVLLLCAFSYLSLWILPKIIFDPPASSWF